MSHVLYIDEAGCPGELTTDKIQPVFCLTGLMIPAVRLRQLTDCLLRLKREFYPNISRELDHDLTILLHEIKGSDLRKDITRRGRNRKRRAIRIIDKIVESLEDNQVRILSRIYIKKPGDHFDGKAVYTFAVQAFCEQFQHFLITEGDMDERGIVILDSRREWQNSNVSFSIFTKKFRISGDPYDRLIETPLFGHSESMAGLQFADLVASSVLTPMAIHVYCKNHIENIHVEHDYSIFKERYSQKVKELQYRFHDGNKFQGGVVVIDRLLKARSARLLFQ